MKIWIKRTLIGIFGATALFGGFAAWAHSHRHGPWGQWSEADSEAMKTRLIEKAGKRLDLDVAQKAKLGLLADALREQRKALVGASDPRKDLQSLIAGPTFDRSKAGTLIDGKVAAITGKSPAVVTAMADFYDSLKPEQQAKLRDFMARGGHHGRHGGDDHGGA